MRAIPYDDLSFKCLPALLQVTLHALTVCLGLSLPFVILLWPLGWPHVRSMPAERKLRVLHQPPPDNWSRFVKISRDLSALNTESGGQQMNRIDSSDMIRGK